MYYKNAPEGYPFLPYFVLWQIFNNIYTMFTIVFAVYYVLLLTMNEWV